jgi:maltooligosyltrehalose trehalohydrolase
MIPLLFMGDEVAASEPFLYFISHTDELAEAVRQGRQQEHSHIVGQHEATPSLPDPNASQSFDRSRPVFEPRSEAQRASLELYQQLLDLRQREITPGLPGTRALGARVLAMGALCARWRLGDGRLLRIDLNLSSQPVPHTPPEQARLLFESTQDAARQLQQRVLAPYCALVTLGAAEGLPILTGTHS